MAQVLQFVLTEDDDVIQVGHSEAKALNDSVDHKLEVRRGLGQTKWDGVVLVFAEASDESCFWFGLIVELYVVVSSAEIEGGEHGGSPKSGVHLVNLG